MTEKLLAAALLLLTPALRAGAAEPRAEQQPVITTDDGWLLHARYLRPAGEAPLVVLIHSQKSDSGEWKLFLDQLKRYGYGYMAPDLRGHGRSVLKTDGSTVTYKAFAVSGADNDFNKMIRDVDAAINYALADSTAALTEERLVLAGSVLGANLAIKAGAIRQAVPMVAAFSPVLNVNDVLTVNPLRAYGRRPLLLAAGANRAKQYKEFQLLNDIARLSCGRENVTVMVEPKGFGTDLFNKYNVRKFFEWIRNPRLPPVVEYSTAAASGLPEEEAGAEGAMSEEGNYE